MSRSVTWMYLDKLGGIHNFVANLLGHRLPDNLDYHAILERNLEDRDDPSDGDLKAAVSQVVFQLPPENYHSVLRRIARQIPAGEGAIVSNDWLSLATAAAHRTGKALVYINHGDFQHYYDLAVMYEPSIDRFITYTQTMYQRLNELLPRRRDDILLIPYGVEIPAARKRDASPVLRLLYVGRLDPSKGVFDLPVIDAALKAAGVATSWTIQGPGPAENELKQAWGTAPHVTWNGRTSMDKVKEQYFAHDVLVMPSRAEGLPVALLESMAAGCVPVVSDLPSGVADIVENGVSGFRAPIGDTQAFAAAIASLAADRSGLTSMSMEARSRIASRYNVAVRAPEYQNAIAAVAERPPRWSRSIHFHGSRLDKPWIPNVVVKSVRSLRSRLRKTS